MTIKVLRPINGGKDIYVLRDAKLKFKNFSGKKGQYPNGNRNVSVIIDEEDKAMLESKGYYVNDWVNPNTNEHEYTVRLNIKMLPGNTATVKQHVGNNPDYVLLTAETIESLDMCSIFKADVSWTYGFNKMNNRWSAYLHKLDAFIVPDEFAPDAGDYYIETYD